jgi:hypothetical protein
MTRQREQLELQVDPDLLDGVDAVKAEPGRETLLASVHAGCELALHGASLPEPLAIVSART